ncbi:hypothetical protein ACFWNN_02405 [Lentzea sp. NPDC058450]|uniref:hypothetical protein n=1 Tax=Lentzea sp. NPDC058450 TaxID=3346505 RepID=UPI0036470514
MIVSLVYKMVCKVLAVPMVLVRRAVVVGLLGGVGIALVSWPWTQIVPARPERAD